MNVIERRCVSRAERRREKTSFVSGRGGDLQKNAGDGSAR